MVLGNVAGAQLSPPMSSNALTREQNIARSRCIFGHCRKSLEGSPLFFCMITLLGHTGSVACHVNVNYLEIFRLRHFWVPLLCRPHLSAGHA